MLSFMLDLIKVSTMINLRITPTKQYLDHCEIIYHDQWLRETLLHICGFQKPTIVFGFTSKVTIPFPLLNLIDCVNYRQSPDVCKCWVCVHCHTLENHMLWLSACRYENNRFLIYKSDKLWSQWMDSRHRELSFRFG